MGYGWEGKLVRLVPLDIDKHLDNAARWVNDPEISQFLKIGDFPITRIAERDWFETQSKGKETDVVFAIETLAGKHLGFSGIHGISWRHGTAITGTLIGDPADWGKGFGSDAAQVRSRYAFDVLGLRILYSGVFEGNDRSLGMLKRAGYVECGRKPRRYWKRGVFVDEIMLYLDREAWLRQRATVSRS